MATKTISLNMEAYNRLRSNRRFPEESFSHVVLRALWNEETITAGELLDRWKDEPPFFTEKELEAIEQAKSADQPPGDKWTAR